MSENTKKQLIENFGTERGSISFTLMVLNSMATDGQNRANEDPGKSGNIPEPESCKKGMLKAIDDEIKHMKTFAEEFQEKEDMEMEAGTLSNFLPDKPMVDKILRYEMTIERQLYRAINQLERLQRARKGDSVPPPINVQISSQN